MATYKELKAQAETLAATAERARQAELRSVIVGLRMKVREYDLTPSDIFGHCRPAPAHGAKRGTVVEPKYRDPESGATWTGRGLEPRWIRGRNRDEFLIGSD
ncbi:H-NS histone family protein [Burkholderia pyrrocinia]